MYCKGSGSVIGLVWFGQIWMDRFRDHTGKTEFNRKVIESKYSKMKWEKKTLFVYIIILSTLRLGSSAGISGQCASVTKQAVMRAMEDGK